MACSNLLESGAFAGQELIGHAGTFASDVLETAASGFAQPVNPLVTGAQSVADTGFGFSAGNNGNAVPESHRERAAEARLSDQRERLRTDPTVRYCLDRIKSLKYRLTTMEKATASA